MPLSIIFKVKSLNKSIEKYIIKKNTTNARIKDCFVVSSGFLNSFMEKDKINKKQEKSYSNSGIKHFSEF